MLILDRRFGVFSVFKDFEGLGYVSGGNLSLVVDFLEVFFLIFFTFNEGCIFVVGFFSKY